MTGRFFSLILCYENGRSKDRRGGGDEKGRPGDIQDAAILALAYGAGLGRAEIVNLDLSDYNRETGELRIRREQANRDRIVYESNGSGEVLKDWVTIRGLEEGPLFCPVTTGGKVRIRRMTGQAIWMLLKRLAERTGVAPSHPMIYGGLSFRTSWMPGQILQPCKNWPAIPAYRGPSDIIGGGKRPKGRPPNC